MKKLTAQMKTTGCRREYIQSSIKYIQWEQKARTDFRSTLNQYWVITDNKIHCRYGLTGNTNTFNKITTIRPVVENYRDVNDNKIKFEGKINSKC